MQLSETRRRRKGRRSRDARINVGTRTSQRHAPGCSEPWREVWSHAYVINLDAERERMVRINGRLKQLSLPFERFAALSVNDHDVATAKAPQHPGNLAAARTHRAALVAAAESGYERVLLLEDDAVFRDDLAEQIRSLLPQIQSVSWDVLHLGVYLLKSGGMLSTNLGTVQSGFHAHAYVVTRSAIPKVIAAFDRALTRGFDFDSFADPGLIRAYIEPVLAVQEPCRSAITGCWENRLYEYFPLFDKKEFFANCREAGPWADLPEPVDKDYLLKKARDRRHKRIFDEAEEIYSRLLAADPKDSEVMHHCAILARQQGNIQRALELMAKAKGCGADSARFYCDHGLILARAGRSTEAMRELDRAVELEPDSAGTHHNRGLVLRDLERIDEAIAEWTKALEVDPNFVVARYQLARTYTIRNQTDLAIPHAHEVLQVSPKHVDALLVRGAALHKKGDRAAALEDYQMAVDLKPDYAEAHSNLAVLLDDLGRLQDALLHHERAVELKYDFHDGHLNFAYMLLATGDWHRGWMELEWRHNHPREKRRFVHPPWNGCPLDGHTLLVSCEQGLGDTLLFVRYVSLLASLGVELVVECQPPLKPLLVANIGSVAGIVSVGEPLPPCNMYVKLMSLPGIMGTAVDSIPNGVPYLRADPERVTRWKDRLAGPEFKVGISWQGNPEYPKDAERSIPLSAFRPLSQVPGVKLYNLQRNCGVEQLEQLPVPFPIERLEGLDADGGAFMDTAAVMKNLDLVITSDTAIAHLAGALGVPVWVALCSVADWRWLRDRNDSPWYPTMRLFRQERYGQWPEVFAKLATSLAAASGHAEAGHPPKRRPRSNYKKPAVSPDQRMSKSA